MDAYRTVSIIILNCHGKIYSSGDNIPPCITHYLAKSTDIHQRHQNLRHLEPCMGLNCGSSGFFCNQNDCGSSNACVTFMYCGMSVKTSTAVQRAKLVNAFVSRKLAFACVVGKNPEDPQIEADDTITRGSLVSLCTSVAKS